MADEQAPAPASPRKRKPAKRKTPAKPKPVESELVEVKPTFMQQYGMLVAVAALIGGLVLKDKFIDKKDVAPTPAPAPVVVPNTITLTALPALTTKLAGHPDKAQLLAALFNDWAATLNVAGNKLTSKSALAAVDTTLITMYVKAASVPLEPQVGTEIDACLKEGLGDDPGPLDVKKAQAVFLTMAQALSQVK